MINLTGFLATNPQINLQTADLFSANALAQYNWPEDVNQRELLQSLRTRQRLLKIYPDDAIAAVLESTGFHSAHHIAATGKSAFIQKVMQAFAQLSEIEQPKAFCVQLFGNAERIRRASFELALAAPQTAAAKIVEPGKEINAFFQKGIPDYQRLFGPMFTCDCKDCQSIFGPAAYFTDLMRVVSQYVSPPPETFFSLRHRRPDLWTVPLDCRSSDAEVSYIDIVNEVICQHLKANYLNDTDPMQQMAARVYPFSMPFNPSLYTIRGGLEALGTSLSSIYRLLEAPALAASAEALRLSPEQLSLITGSYQTSLARLYGFHDESLSDEEVCDALSDQRVFLQKTGLSPDQLEELVYQRLKKGSGTYAMQNKGSQNIQTEEISATELEGSITIECWIFPTATYTEMSILGKGSGEQFYFFLNNRNLRCKYGDAPGFSSATELNLNAWTHIAWTRNVGTGENIIYVNGVLDSTHTVSESPKKDKSAIAIGYIGGSSFHGGITELRIWSEVRSADLIRKMMYLRLQNYTDAHLFAYWPLNEQTGKMAYDLGPHRYDATATNYTTAFYEGVPIGSTSELSPIILHNLYLNKLLSSNQFISIAKPAVSQGKPLLNLFASPELVGLSDNALRQMAVYIRLQAQTGWSFGELDWLLKAVVDSLGIPTQLTINDAMIELLGQVAGLVKKYKIPIDELSSFWSEMK
ncbi:MAG TPA: LamG-like jellyroll fold domain-containing protein, partial [Pseudosphingobacterium sp.]|nr:LamG-like jellyroll fold domain-containing protein [Pseudosphingobacterium sp.]